MVFLHYFLEAKTIKFVKRPSQNSHSADSILWINIGWIMKEEGIFIQHSENLMKGGSKFLQGWYHLFEAYGW